MQPFLVALPTINNYIEDREYGWIDNSDSDTSGELFEEELKSNLMSTNEDEIPFARHGLVVMLDLEEVAI